MKSGLPDDDLQEARVRLAGACRMVSDSFRHNFCHDDLDPQLPYLGPFHTDGAQVLLQPQGQTWLAFWSANSAPELITTLQLAFEHAGLHNAVCQIQYLPPAFELEFLAAGWRPAGEYVEAWIEDLKELRQSPSYHFPVREMLSSEVLAAAQITASCCQQTRARTRVTPEAIEAWTNQPNQRIFLALDDTHPVGVLFCRLYGFDHPRGTVCWINDMVVQPGFQNRGLGRELLMVALQWGLDNHASRAGLAVDVQNERAIHLYEAAGFILKSGRGQINLQCDLP